MLSASQGDQLMSKIVRYQFMGNWVWFWLLCITGAGLPFALLYLLNCTIRLDSVVDDPEKFVEEYRSGKLSARPGHAV
jgi:hypothetical protein